ncbi:hypothetical protein LCGC14_0391880 [marine sediment metagenome]|uniref:Uncharacterized protein n=1 Tax=marine sediment metagenome TaxID=412755 RepID=A0A0F9T4Y5_9ZZZZ
MFKKMFKKKKKVKPKPVKAKIWKDIDPDFKPCKDGKHVWSKGRKVFCIKPNCGVFKSDPTIRAMTRTRLEKIKS